MLTFSRTSFQTLANTVKVALKFAALAMFLAFQAINLPAHAENLSAADEKSIRAVVEGQLAAFAKDDANKAFSFAAPNVRKAVGSAASFMSMVRSDYPVVYRPASVAFLRAEGKDGDVIQRVQMLDASGDAWLAVYSLQKQKDKSWRITGCAVVENKGRMV
ncbi:MAG: DUF4864 domain-containing protein [Polaromonas sp.]|nr:DUF4864 domain-containing protein [Polaromonas sp.]